VVGFIGADGEALERFEFAEVIFDQVTPLVHLLINIEGLSPAAAVAKSRSLRRVRSGPRRLKLTNEVQHLKRVLGWDSIAASSALKSDLRLPGYMVRGPRSGKSLQL
jgi:hypothetical protein